jgi:hypothetical protein
MTKPIKPASPSASTGEGKSFLERMQRGMANDPTANPEKAKMFAEKLEKYVNEGKALNEARNEHKKVPGLSRAGGGGGAGGDFSGMKGLDKPFKKGGKVKKFNDGGMSLEEKYPGAKITRVPYKEPPKKSETKEFKEAAETARKAPLASAGHRITEPKFTDSGDTMNLKKMGRGRVAGGGGGSAGGDFSGMKGLDKPYKAGGKVSSASKRADGCAIRGKTRA